MQRGRHGPAVGDGDDNSNDVGHSCNCGARLRPRRRMGAHRIASPESVGWSSQKLALAREHSRSLGTAAVMVVVNGRVLDEWGNTHDRFNTNSIRKSILSSLVGMAVADGQMR